MASGPARRRVRLLVVPGIGPIFIAKSLAMFVATAGRPQFPVVLIRWRSKFMCSRYNLSSPPEAVRHLFGLSKIEAFPPRSSIAPTEPVIIVHADREGGRAARLVRWGLIPGWVKDPRQFSTLINARSETAAEKPAFRGALRHRRCLVPASAFYEWSGPRGKRQPHLVTVAGQDVFALAGLWETWLGADGSEIDTMAILTTSANAEMAAIHDRMPVIIAAADFDRWLDCRPGSAVPIEDLLAPLADGRLTVSAAEPKAGQAAGGDAQKQQRLPF